jgi:hypothetical protein
VKKWHTQDRGAAQNSYMSGGGPRGRVFCFVFFVVLGFELWALCLLGSALLFESCPQLGFCLLDSVLKMAPRASSMLGKALH